MNTSGLLDQVLGYISIIKGDKQKLEALLDFLQNQLMDDKADETVEIPAKFDQVIQPIAQAIDAGFICFLNLDTLEMEEIRQNSSFFDDDTEEELEELSHYEWSNCLQFSPPETEVSFRIMYDFAWQLKDEKLKTKLISVLEQKKPFANFKRTIDSSAFRKSWFEYKDMALQNHVREQIALHLEYR